MERVGVRPDRVGVTLAARFWHPVHHAGAPVPAEEEPALLPEG